MQGCDVIALAADFFLKNAPKVQLVMVGPVGDLWGFEAQKELVRITPKYVRGIPLRNNSVVNLPPTSPYPSSPSSYSYFSHIFLLLSPLLTLPSLLV